MQPIERNVNQTLWFAIMREPYDGETEFENDTFVIKPYCWTDKWDNSWNFFHKPSGLKLNWYKYPLRSVESNQEVTHEQLYAVLWDCMNSIDPRVQNLTFDKWW